jgi:predicted permease
VITTDVLYGLRQLKKSPGFAAAVLVTLTIGIGANTAIFSIVESVLLSPLPFPGAARLVRITANNPGLGLRDVSTSAVELDDLRLRSDVFDEVSVVWPVSANLTGAKEPERLELLGVSASYFRMLGASPQIGRLFDKDDEIAQGFSGSAVISDGLWHRSYGGDPSVLGRQLRLDNDLYTIVGVVPPAFRHPGKTVSTDVDAWAAAGFKADPFPKPTRSARGLPGMIGRLKPGLGLEEAQAKVAAFSARLRQDFPADYPPAGRFEFQIQPLRESLVGNVRPMLLVLSAAVLLIIVVASVNIANLLLARASGRQREIAVRLAIGATPGRIVRQLLTESMVLSVLAGGLGLVAARAGENLAVRLLPPEVARLVDVGLNPRVLVFALVVSVLTGAAFGLTPALQAARGDLAGATREGSWGSGTGVKTSRVRGALIVTEMALAVVLMVGAGLLLRTLFSLLKESPGFDPTHVVTAGVWLPVPNDPKADPYSTPAARNNLLRGSLARLRAIPGVEGAATTSALPTTAQTFRVALYVEDRPVESSSDIKAELIVVTPRYFEVMTTGLVRGRLFTEADEAGKQQVALVDESTARRFWGATDPIGKRVRLSQSAAAPWVDVVGVVVDVKHDGLETNGVPHVYRPAYQTGSRIINYVLKTSLPASALEPQVRRAVQSVDPALPIFGVRSMDDVLAASLAARRFSAQLIGAFAVLSLLLACVGVYGLLAFMVGQRSREIGVRMALGARPASILAMFLKSGALFAGVGCGLGLVLSAFAAPAIASQLYGVKPFDPAVFVGVPLVLLLVAFAASVLPARRAAGLDPILVLREG